MSVLIGIVAFFAAAYYCFKAAEYYRLFKHGVQTTAVVRNIERVVRVDEDDNEVVTHYLHLDLPDFKGWKLDKQYEKPINPRKYAVGDTLDIVHHKDKPTEFVVKKELNFMDSPKICLLIGVLLYLASYVSCYVVE